MHTHSLIDPHPHTRQTKYIPPKMKLGILALAALVVAHGSHDSNTPPPGLSWQNWHMLEEHKMDSYDSESFFTIHALKNQQEWTPSDILNLYGLLRESVVGDGSGMGRHSHDQEGITKEAKDHVVSEILRLVDSNNDGKITLDEWKKFTENGGELPDFGYGQGHHLDFESEYEEHHWKEFHMNDDPDIKIKHKEDIEHELLHHEHEMEETHNANPELRETTRNFLSQIRLDNVPQKYKS
ncbi:hypothetical protein PGUG_00976 [Meyerozyma guilliermondii ATCC 6260]|uniref:EF-hand domain-containing protein n=1 Tax=Meyerozyma guilliermondii (strain ATCC 6260 / CBS 566 / DSM 6381 / JCM 1539 / NBRC 10279 / NRRL Y-324) TaxID=294746 RepID=A5DCH1_PICGU|nr:uncharacterized protein PGUG_00976 [Meyerozyma guilliermondii ATCC 6260]EDK36878.2 hypothetical protein PGUG_00976 [Meyerozyma guilliermondii ATCC 6260]